MKTEEIERGYAVTKKLMEKGSMLTLHERGQIPYCLISWVFAWKTLDFSAAIKKVEGNGENVSEEGQVSPVEGGPIMYGHGLQRFKPTRMNSEVFCKAEGGYLVDWAATKKTAALVEEYLREDPQLERL